MARFTKTWSDGLFMGWDELGQTCECTEATLPEDLGQLMPQEAEIIFEGLEVGATHRTFDNIRYFREY